MKVNKFPGVCPYCEGRVAANAGALVQAGRRFRPAHLACLESGQSEVITMYSPVTGNSWTINRSGRCEDAPCCGCCTC